MRRLLLRPLAGAAFLLALVAGTAAAQATAYVSLDDPRLPMLEHLILRGDVADPSPMIRPFLRSEAVRVLKEAEERLAATEPPAAVAALYEQRGSLTLRTIRDLLAWYEDAPSGETPQWMVRADVGAQAYTQGRRDLLREGGPGRTRPYGELELNARLGNVAVVSRGALEARLRDDPDWPQDAAIPRLSKVTARFPEAYASAQFKWVRLFFGQVDRNWGPQGIYGLSQSNFRYPTGDFAMDFVARRFRFSFTWSELRDTVSATGEQQRRFFLAHRLSIEPTDGLQVGLWETSLLGGRSGFPQGLWANPFSAIRLVTSNGLSDRGNQMVGLDVRWRIRRGLHFDLDFALDELDTNRQPGELRTPNRWGLTSSLYGTLGARVGWRALYSTATSIAFRTFNPIDNFTDVGRGIGRNFADNEQLTLTLTAPATPAWLVGVEGTLLRQGEGRINDPFPSAAELAAFPTRFLGTVERTLRLAGSLSGRQGPVTVNANAGVHRVTNAGNQPGVTETRFVARVQGTVGVRLTGAF